MSFTSVYTNFLPVIEVVGYALPIILENEALVFGGALQGSSSSPPSSCNRISASASRFFRWVPNFSVLETGMIKI